MDPVKEEQRLHGHRLRCRTWQSPQIAEDSGDRDTSSVSVDYLCARAGDGSQQGKPLLLKLDKPLSSLNKNRLRGCSPRAAASSACSRQPRIAAPLPSHGLTPRRLPSADGAGRTAASQRGRTGTHAHRLGWERVPSAVPRALPAERAAPALGGSCSLPSSPAVPHGQDFPLRQALTRAPNSHELPQAAAFLLTQAGFGQQIP